MKSNQDLEKYHDEEERKKWYKDEKASLLKYCSNKQLDMHRIMDKFSLALLPYFSLWAVENRKTHEKLWVITGELPHDHTSFQIAEDARSAIRHFFMSWNLKAENMERTLNEMASVLNDNDQQKLDMIKQLRESADRLSEVYLDDNLWAKHLPN